MRTSTLPPAEASWFVVDATDKTLGRLAADIAHVLRGKHKVSWSPHQVMSDHVVVINTKNIVLKGVKSQQKEYIRHSGYFGHLKRTPFARLFAKDPNQVVARAVRGMLPRTKLRPRQMRFLHLFPESEHDHTAQKPQESLSLFS